MKFKIPKEKLRKGTPKKMTDKMIEKGIYLLDTGNSERFVAGLLGVSRATARRHCKRGYKEEYRKKYKCYAYIKTQLHQIERRREGAKRRWQIIAELYPEKIRKYRKLQKQKRGKEYFKIKAREFRKKHPDYYKKYYEKAEQLGIK